MLQSMSDTHMDMVTVATFHPLQPHLFFSGSDDGLIAAFDFSQGFSEDDGFAVPSQTQLCMLNTLTPRCLLQHQRFLLMGSTFRAFSNGSLLCRQH